MIIKPKITNHYSIISNHLLRDKNLSLNARMLAAFLHTLPTDWKIYVRYIANELGLGIRTVQRAFRELVNLEYIEKVQVQDEKSGKFTNAFTIIFTTKCNEISKELEEQKAILEDENEEEKEIKKELEKAYEIEAQENKVPILAVLKHIEEDESLQNESLKTASKLCQSLLCHTYIRKEFLDNKNSFILKSQNENFHIFYKKEKLPKKEFLDFSYFNENEKEKIEEWFKYKAKIKHKPLNVLSKQGQLKKLKELKLAKQNIIKLIDTSISNGWQGLWAQNISKTLSKWETEQARKRAEIKRKAEEFERELLEKEARKRAEIKRKAEELAL